MLDAADALGYVPNAAAQMLAGHRSHIIGLVFPRTHPHLAAHLFLLQFLESQSAVRAATPGMRLINHGAVASASVDFNAAR